MIENQEEGPKKELYEHHSFTATAGQEPLRVDKFFNEFYRKCNT
jgi:hypothetical protein